jgi:hypothetical protein
VLLAHTRRLGTIVIEEANVREALFEGELCTGVRYSFLHSEDVIDVHAPFVIDAAGQAKIMARRFDAVGWLWLIHFSDRTCSVGFVAPITKFSASGLKPAAVLYQRSASAAARAVNTILDKPDSETSIRQSYEDAYRVFLDTVISFVCFFYGPSKKVGEYFGKARELIDPIEQLKAREDFIILISGLFATRPLMDYVPPGSHSPWRIPA